MENKYSVCQFFVDGQYEYVRRWVSAEEAVKAFKIYTNNVAARIGTTTRVIITDSGDMTNYEWKFGEGIVYPKKEDYDTLRNQIE